MPIASPPSRAPNPLREAASNGEAPTVKFAAFQHRAFRLFWTGNVLSLVGTLAQDAARGWLVRSLAGPSQEFLIALVAACGTLPILLFTLYAGVVADRVDKRRGLIVTNALSMLLALVLAALTLAGLATVWNVALLAFLVGIVSAFDIPIRQSFNVEMVGREDLPNAIALNSSAFNGARVLGPAVGGALLRTVGAGGCFLANAVSYLALLWALVSMRREIAPFKAPRDETKSRVWDGARWVARHGTLRVVVFLVAVNSLLAMSYGTLVPVFAKDVFGSDERGYSLLLTASGLGAFGSSVALAAGGAMRHRGKRLLLGAFGFGLAVAGFGASPSIYLAGGCALLAGWLLLTFLTTANTLVQTLAPDEMRGQVFAIYSLALIGTAPFGALLMGGLAHAFGPRMAVQLGGVAAAGVTFATYACFRCLWKEK